MWWPHLQAWQRLQVGLGVGGGGGAKPGSACRWGWGVGGRCDISDDCEGRVYVWGGAGGVT